MPWNSKTRPVLFSVKEAISKANASLAQEKAMGQRIDNQAPAGAMKPCFVRALIQRGALR